MAAPTPSQDTLIAAEIEALREKHSDTRELYREVCALLFFRFGITPTANRLYQYVRKGSMSTPAQVLSRFWADLRERTRVRIDHPDLPPALREAAGELVLDLWGRAQAAAARGFDAQSTAAAEAVAAAEARAGALDDEVGGLQQRLALLGGELAEERERSAELGRQLATIQGRLASMTELLRDQAEDMRALRDELGVARRDVARAVGEANAVRVQLALARNRGSRKPLGGVPGSGDAGQEALGLEPALSEPRADADAHAGGEGSTPGTAGAPGGAAGDGDGAVGGASPGAREPPA